MPQAYAEFGRYLGDPEMRGPAARRNVAAPVFEASGRAYVDETLDHVILLPGCAPVAVEAMTAASSRDAYGSELAQHHPVADRGLLGDLSR